jgi:hypothetical protein
VLPAANRPSTLEVLKLPGVASASLSYALVKMTRFTLMNWLPTFFATKVTSSSLSFKGFPCAHLTSCASSIVMF